MGARKLFVFFMVAVFSLGFASAGLSAGMGEERMGTVTKIEGGTVTIKDSMGIEETIEPKNSEALTILKVGDHVSMKEGILTKVEVGGAGHPAPPTGPKY